MKWVSPTDLHGNPVSGQTGLLSGTIRGVMYRKSALERFEQEGIIPAQMRAQRRAEKHRAAWEAASKDDRNRYRNFIQAIFTVKDAQKVGSDFHLFGVGDDGTARATIYVHCDTGFAYVAPTMDEWIAQHRLIRVVPYAKEGNYVTVLELGFAHDPNQTHRLVTDELDVYPDTYGELDDDDAASTSTSASTDAPTSDKPAAQTLDQPSAPADGEGDAHASTGELAPANEPSAGSGAAKPARGLHPAASSGFTWAPAPPAPEPQLSSDERYDRFCAVAKRHIDESCGYVVYDGGPEGATVCREVLPRDE